MNRTLSCLTAATMLVAAASAQVNYVEAFTSSAGGWTVTGGFSPGYSTLSTCSGGHVRTNLYQASPNNVGNFVSPSLGTSLGGSTTITFDYRLHNYVSTTAIGSPATPPFGSTNVDIATSASGPWTTIGSFANETQSASCISKSFTFTPPAGALFVRLNNVRSAGDIWWCFDNVSVVETTGSCAGTPAPGGVTGAPAAVCPGEGFTLGVQSPPTGSGVTFQWFASTDGGATYSSVGTNPSLSTSQTQTTQYYCAVTCSAGPATGNTSVVSIPMSTPSNVQDWSTGVITPNCWSISNPVGTYVPSYSTASAYGVGTGCASFNFFNASDTYQLVLTSPVLAAVGSGQQVYFDVAGATYTGGEIDHIVLEESNDSGATWTAIVDMNNAPNGVGVLNTGGATISSFTAPTAAQWASLSYPLSNGTNRIRFRGVSNFGNWCHLDNVSVGVLPSARHSNYGVSCASPAYTLNAGPAPVTGTTFTYNQAGIPEAAPTSGIYFGVVVLSLGQLQPGVPLTTLTAGAIDSPCNLNVTSLDLLLSFVSLAPTDASVTFTVPPAAPAGVVLYSQAAALVTPVAPNNAGIVTSNAVRSFINTF